MCISYKYRTKARLFYRKYPLLANSCILNPLQCDHERAHFAFIGPWQNHGHPISERYMNPSLGFRELAGRLIRHLNAMVRRGEISERGLARLTLYSQPHIHNVLNGKRAMTIELADQIMALLTVPLPCLLSQDELSGRLPGLPADVLPVPILGGSLGGGKAFPRDMSAPQQRLFPAAEAAGTISPVLVRIDRSENSMRPTVWPGDIVLLDRSLQERRRPTIDSIYAVCWRNKGWIGRCRRVSRALVLVVDNAREAVSPPPTIPLDHRDVLDVVRGRIAWLGRDLPADPPLAAGM
jgi:hypothetical protein